MERPEIHEYVRHGITRCWSPDQIAGRRRFETPKDRSCQVSHQTIYRWIAQQGEYRLHWERFLRFTGKRRRGRNETRGRIPGTTMIDARPAVVDRRNRYGDWEGDTVVGARQRGAIATVVERKSGYLLAGKAKHRRAAPVNRAIQRQFEHIPAKLRKTLTLDNGKEFSSHEELAAALGLEIYFAQPYCSWQRGSNEHANGLLRQYFPKGTDFNDVSHHALKQAVTQLNDRPRKRLGYRTPSEVLAKHLCCD